MVQRKVPNKLGIQTDHVKSEKLLVNLRPSSFQHQDGKNRGGADLKKKMKKSRSIKHSDFESLRSPNLRRQVPQPGKPPPLDVPSSAAVPQKQSPIKALDVSPNYMKSTSSFDARKERSQVSNRNSQTSVDSKSPSRKNSNNSKASSGSGHKPARTLTRTSSLKLVRTLTKTPSFKPARASAKKCSPVVLCENLDVQKSTCSSTLKDSKFPSYLTLNPGGTESEGTSVMKVCPYTYCSLNGHHHAPLPPLKCFLSARRRMLKTQKCVKLGCLSPRRAKPSGDSMKEIDIGEVTLDEKSAIQEVDLNSPAITPQIHKEHADFFIEIYSKEKEDGANMIGRSKHNRDDHDTTDFSVIDFMPLVGGSDETAAEHNDVQVVESLSDESSCSEIDFEDNLDQHLISEVISTEMDIAEFPEEDQKVKVAEEVYPPFLAQEETTQECLINQHDLEVEGPPSFQPDETDSEASDMEWEAAQFSAPYLDDEVDNSIQTNNESDLESGYSSDVDNRTFHDEPIFKPDDIASSCFKVRADEVMQESFDEEGVSSEAWFVDGDFELDGSYQNLESDEPIQVSDNQSHDRLSPAHDAFEKSTTTEEREEDTKSDDVVDTAITSVPVEEPTEEPGAASEDKNRASEADNGILKMNLQLGDDKTECSISVEYEASIDHQGNESLQDHHDATALLGNQESDCSHDFTAREQDETYKEYTANHNNIEVYQSYAVTERSRSSEEVFDRSLLPKNEDSEKYQNCIKQELPTADAGDRMQEKEQVDAAKSLVGIQAFALLQGASDADQDMSGEDHDESPLAASAKESQSNQTFADEGLPAETPDHSSDEQSQTNNVENQNHPENDQDKAENFKISTSVDSEYQTHSGMTRIILAENRDQDIHEMEVEHTINSDAEETCGTAKDTSSTEKNYAIIHAGNNPNQELLKTCKNPRGTIRCKRPVEECEEQRKFNPREPNYLPVEPDPEGETVDLRHQMMDERKNGEEWMLDYALRQAVTKLAPARKRKVALLVEAFETVMPIPKYENHLRHNSAAFAHARPMQTCS